MTCAKTSMKDYSGLARWLTPIVGLYLDKHHRGHGLKLDLNAISGLFEECLRSNITHDFLQSVAANDDEGVNYYQVESGRLQ